MFFPSSSSLMIVRMISISSLVSFQFLGFPSGSSPDGETVFQCFFYPTRYHKENKTQLNDNFANYLRPGGVLYVGHSETLMRSHPKLVAESRTAFRRV